MADEVRRERFLPAERDEVWEAVAGSEGLREWLADEAEVDLRPGGELRLRLRSGEERSGFVEKAEPPERLIFWWRDVAADDDPLTRVELTLTEAEGGTLLRLVETRELTTVAAVLRPAGTIEQPRGPEMSAAAPFALVS